MIKENKKYKSNITKEDLIYLAGLLDGKINLSAQIVHRQNYKYKFAIKVSLRLYENKKNAWFLMWFGKLVGFGSLAKRKKDNWEWILYEKEKIKELLILLKPYLRLKRKLVRLLIEIIDLDKKITNRADLEKVMEKVDEVASYKDLDKRVWKLSSVRKYWKEYEIR